MGLLGEMLEAMNAGFEVENVTNIVELLEIWSRSSRFSLSLSFLSTREKVLVRAHTVKIYNIVVWI